MQLTETKSLDSKVDCCPGVSRPLNTFSNTSKLSRLHPWYVTGLSDGESCFIIGVSKRDSSRKKKKLEDYTFLSNRYGF